MPTSVRHGNAAKFINLTENVF